MQAGEWDGTWWIPGSSHRVVGTLRLEADDFVLETQGALDPPSEAADEDGVVLEPWTQTHHPVLHGRLDDGSDVTLLECDGLAVALPFDAVSEAWHPRAALLGTALAHDQDEIYTHITVDLQHLAAWAGEPGIAVKVTQDKAGGIVSATLGAEHRVLQRAELAFATIELVAEPIVKWSHARGEVAIEVALEVALPQPVDWTTAWRSYAVPLRDLLATLLGRGVVTRRVLLRRDGASTSPATRLVLRTADLRRAEGKKAHSSNFLYTAASLPGGFEEALQRWWALREQREIAIRELVGVLQAPHAYIDDKLLAYSRAAATMQTASSKEEAKAAAETEDQIWLDEVRANLPDRLHPSVLGRLGKKGPSGRHQLAALIASLGDVGTWLAGGDIATFAYRIFNTRNHLAHPSSTIPHHFLEDRDRVTHTLAMGWIVRALLLRDLGASLEEIRNQLERTEAPSIVAAIAESMLADGSVTDD